jgi:hypothetical protein
MLGGLRTKRPPCGRIAGQAPYLIGFINAPKRRDLRSAASGASFGAAYARILGIFPLSPTQSADDRWHLCSIIGTTICTDEFLTRPQRMGP